MEEVIDAAESDKVEEASGELTTAEDDYNSMIKNTTAEEGKARRDELQEAINIRNEKAVNTQTVYQNALNPGDTISKSDMSDMLNEVNKVQNMTSAEKAVSAAKGLSSKIKSTASKVADTTQASNETVMKKVDELAKNTLSDSEYKEYQNIMSEHESNLQKLADDLNKGTDPADSEKNVNDTGKKIEESLENNKQFSDKMEASVGRRKSVVKEIMKYASLLKYLAGPVGLWALLHYISTQLTGCYKYSGLDSEKITCSQTPFTNVNCGCGSAQEGINTSAKLSKYCDDHKTFANYPFCCPPTTPDRPTCSGKPGDENAIYYGWHEFTPATILAGIPGDIAKLVSAAESGISGLLKNILKWVLYVILILVILYILFVIGKHFLSKAMSSSKNNKFHYKSK